MILPQGWRERERLKGGRDQGFRRLENEDAEGWVQKKKVKLIGGELEMGRRERENQEDSGKDSQKRGSR